MSKFKESHPSLVDESVQKPRQYPTKEGKCMCCGQYTKYLNAIELQYIGGTHVDWRCLRCYYDMVKSYERPKVKML